MPGTGFFINRDDEEFNDQDQQDQDQKKKSQVDPDYWKKGFPSTAELQQTKQERKGYIDKLRDKGYPNAAAIAEKVSNWITPDTQEEYISGMMPEIGGIESRAAKPSAEAWARALRDPEFMQLLQKNPTAAEAEIAANKSANRFATQQSSDVAGGVRKPGLAGAEAINPDYKKLSLQQEGSTLDYKKINREGAPKGPTSSVDYSERNQIDPLNEETGGFLMHSPEGPGYSRKPAWISADVRARRGKRK